jgi:hypothetical protein
MTIVDRREQRPEPESYAPDAGHDRAREHGNRIALIADIAEEQLEDAEREREDRNRYEDGLQVLRWLVGAPWSERTLEIDRVLHDEHGSLSEAKIAEYIRLLLNGRTSLDARYAMAARQAKRADRAQATRSAVSEAREVSANLHRAAEAAGRPLARETQPGRHPELPPGPVAAPVPLPRREPMYPPAPPETPAESTGHLLQRVRENGHMVTPEQEAAARKDHQSGPSLGPAPDPQFAVTALPGRIGDTVLMPVSAFFGDAVEPAEDDDTPEPLPFPGAGTADPSAAPSSAKSGADDD